MKEINNSLDSGVLLDGRYKLLRPLSSDGATADVWLALDVNTIDEVYDDDNGTVSSEEESGIKVAIKIYRPKNALDLGDQRFREEFKIVFNCHHENLIRPINFSIFKGTPYLVLPYCKNGSSENLQGKLTEPDDLWKYISDVSKGLSYLHTFNPTIVHQDIKPANILIDDNGNYAVTDFGISSHSGLNRDGYEDIQSGTMAYMAPERFKDDYETIPESDIWSFGATLYEIITGKVPFGELGGQSQLDTGATCPEITESIPNSIKKLIYDCLSLDVSKRPTAHEISKAADNKSYPLRGLKKLYIAIPLAILIALIAAIFIINSKGNSNESVYAEAPIMADTQEETYQKALELLSTKDKDVLLKGLSMLDSLGSRGYVPAIYQLAYTYGWYNDSASISRKEILDIEYYPKKSSKWLCPKDKQTNIKAIGLFARIDEIGDPNYPEINAEALYRLACYYVNENDVLKEDTPKAKKLLNKALEWAEKGSDQNLIDKIKRNLNVL